MEIIARIGRPLFSLRWVRLTVFTGATAAAAWAFWPSMCTPNACTPEGCSVAEKVHEATPMASRDSNPDRRERNKAWRARMASPDLDVPSLVALESETVTFTITSQGCFHHSVKRMRFAGENVVMEHEDGEFDEGKQEWNPKWKPLGTLKLSAEDLAGMDLWLLEMATVGEGGCTSTTEVKVNVEGSEKAWSFENSTCSDSGTAHRVTPWMLLNRLEKTPTENP